MADFRRLSKEYRNEFLKTQDPQSAEQGGGLNPTGDPLEFMRNKLIESQEGQTRDQVQAFDPFEAGRVGNPENEDQVREELDRQNSAFSLGQDVRSANRDWDYQAWNPDEIYQDYVSQIGENIAFGTGQVIGQYGDLFHALDVMLTGDREGNMLSRALQDYGQEVMDNNTSYIPPEIADPEFKISSFMDPRFWTIHGARFVPQLVEILATRGVASGAGKLAQKGVTSLTRKAVEEGAEAMFKRGAVGTTSGKLAKGAAGTIKNTELKGLKKLTPWQLVTDQGKMIKPLSNAIENATAGALTNIRVGLSNAGEVHNELSSVVDENGNPVYSNEDLAEVTADAFANNLSYIGMDMASWAFTFGKGKLMGKGGVRDLTKGKRAFDAAQQSKYIGGLAAKTGSKMLPKTLREKAQAALMKTGEYAGKKANQLKGPAGLGLKMAGEGLEETIQESWEEWSKLKAVYDAGFDLNDYAGGKYKDIIQGKDDGMFESAMNGDFLDFYLSKENEATRTIAFGLGAMAGGAFNFRQAFNRNAKKHHDLRLRSEAFKAITSEGSQDRAIQAGTIMEQIVEIVDDDKLHLFAPLMQKLQEDGVVSDEDFEVYENLFEEVSKEKEAISKLNIKGKSALFKNKMQSKVKGEIIERKLEEMRQKMKDLRETIGPDTEGYDAAVYRKAVKKEAEAAEAELAALYDAKEAHDSNVRALLSGGSSKRAVYRSKWDQETESFKMEKVGDSEVSDNFHPFYASDAETATQALTKNAKNKASKTAKKIFEFFSGKKTVKKDGVDDDSYIEIDSIEDSKAYTDEDREALNEIMKNKRLSKEEKEAIAKKHGVTYNENDPGIGEEFEGNFDGVAKATEEVADINENRENEAEREYLNQKIQDIDNSEANYQQENEAIQEEAKALKAREEEILNSLESETGKNASKKGIKAVTNSLNKRSNEIDKELERIEGEFDQAIKDNDQEKMEALSKESEPLEAEHNQIKSDFEKVSEVKENEDGEQVIQEALTDEYNALRERQDKNEKSKMSETMKARRRGYEERIGELDGIPLEEQRKARQEKAKEQRKKKLEETQSKISEITGRIKEEMGDLLGGAKEITEEAKNTVLNKLIDEGLINESDFDVYFGFMDRLFQKKKKKKKKRSHKKVDGSSGSGDTGFRYRKSGKKPKTKITKEDIKNAKDTALKAGKQAIHETRKAYRAVTNKGPLKVGKFTHEAMSPFNSWSVRGATDEWVINENLKNMFPNAVVSAHNVYNMQQTLGIPTLAVTIGNTVFIDSSRWGDDMPDYMHEMGHVYMNLSRGEEETERLLDHFMKNTKLLNNIKDEYWDQEELLNSRGERVLVSDFNAYKEGKSKEEVLAEIEKYIEDGHYTRIPDREQTIWMDELFAYNFEGPSTKTFNKFFEVRDENFRKERIRRWFKWLKNKVIDLDKDYYTSTLKSQDAVSSDQMRDDMAKVFDNLQSPFQGKPVRASVRFRRELEAADQFSQEMVDIRNQMDKEKSYVRGNYNTGKVNRAPSALGKEDFKYFRENGYYSLKSIMKIAQKVFNLIDDNYTFDYNELTDTEKEIYQAHEAEILNRLANDHDSNAANIVAKKELNQDEMQNLDGYSDDEINIFENKEKYAAKFNKYISGFINTYNKFQKIKAGLEGDIQNVVLSDKDNLKDALFDLADLSQNPAEFIYRLENDEDFLVQDFVQYLKKNRQDPYDLLKGIFVIYSNMTETTPTSSYFNANGELVVGTALSQREENNTQAVWEKTERTFMDTGKGNVRMPFYIDDNGDRQPMYALSEALSNIRRNDFTDKDTRTVLKFFSHYSTDVDRIVDNGYLIMNGRSWDVHKLTRAFLMSKETFSDNKLRNKGRDFFNAIQATDRIYKARMTVLNAENNQVNSTIVNNGLMKLKKRMEKDAREMTLSRFIKEYQFGNKSANVAESNLFLKQVYDSVQETGRIDIHPTTGLKNQKTNIDKTAESMNSEEKNLFDFFTYMARSGATYMTDIGRLSDSKRTFHFQAKTININDWGNYNKGFFDASEMPSDLVNAFRAYNKFKRNSDQKPLSYDEFIGQLNKEIESQISFFQDAYLRTSRTTETANGPVTTSSYKQLNDIINPATKRVNEKGRHEIAQFVLNEFVHKTSIAQVMYPSFKLNENDLLKRSKSMSSPVFSMPSNVKIETIYLNDLIEDVTETDGISFILDSDAQRMRDYYGNQMKVGSSLKILNAGLELDSPNFRGMNTYDKGLTIELNDEYVAQNPQYKDLYELMLKRKQSYIDKINQGAPMDDLAKGFETVIFHAVPASARKVKEAIPKVNIEYINENGDLEQDSVSFDDFNILNGLTDLEKTKFDAMMNAMYYENAVDEDGDPMLNHVGLSGENFGVQQVLDIAKDEAILSNQFVNFLSTNIMDKNDATLVHEILEGLSSLQKEAIQELQSIIEENDPKKIRKFLLDNINKEYTNPLQVAALEEDNLDVSSPIVRQLVTNTISNILRKKGNNLKTKGAPLRQEPNTYYDKYTGQLRLRNSRVNFMTRQVEIGEAVVGRNLKGSVKAREYFDFNETDSNDPYKNNLIKKINRIAKDKNLSDREKSALAVKEVRKLAIVRGIEKPVLPYFKNNKLAGVYIQGDRILATRIPAHGPQSSTTAEVIGYLETNAYNIQLASEFALVNSGGDFDGDQVFVNYKDNRDPNSKWNEVFDKIDRLYQNPDVVEEANKAISFKEEAESAIDSSESVWGKSEEENTLYFSPTQTMNNQANTLESKNSIGITASSHGLLSLLSNYNTGITLPVSIDGRTADRFSDIDTENRVLNSAKLMNLIFDNTSNGYASKLGINVSTASTAVALINLGYSLDQVAVILNSPIAKKYFRNKASRSNMFYNSDFSEVQVTDDQGRVYNSNNRDVVTTGNEAKSLDNEVAILELLKNIQQIENDVQTLNKIMRGHNEMERNPHESDHNIKEAEDLLNNNKRGQVLVFNESFRRNPRVQNYLSVAKTHDKMIKRMDNTWRDSAVDIYNTLRNSSLKNLTEGQKTKIKNDAAKVFDAIAFGLTNYGDVDTSNVATEVSEYITELQQQIIDNDWDPQNVYDTQELQSAFDNSILFKKALIVSERRNYVGLNTQFFENGYIGDERQQAINEFNSLPEALIEKMLLHDFKVNGWATPNSIIHLASPETKMRMDIASKQDIKSKATERFNTKDSEAIKSTVILNNLDSISNVKFPLFYNDVPSENIMNEKKLLNALYRNEPFVVKYHNSKYNVTVAYEFNGFSPDEMRVLSSYYAGKKGLSRKLAEDSGINIFENPNLKSPASVAVALLNYNNVKRYRFKGSDIENAQDKVFELNVGNKPSVLRGSDNNTDPSGGSDNSNTEIRKPQKTTDVSATLVDWLKKKSQQPVRHRRDLGSSNSSIRYRRITPSQNVRFRSLGVEGDFLHYTRMLSFAEFNRITNRGRTVSEDQMRNLYRKYRIEQENASKYASKFTENYLKQAKLVDLLKEYNQLATGDKLANAVALLPVIREITNRYMAEQSQLTGKQSDGQDINLIEKYFMSNNVPSNHPAAQAMVRYLEIEYKNFLKERNKYMTELNNATNDLYLEQMGYKAISDNYLKNLYLKAKYLFDSLIKNKANINEKLYGELIIYEYFIDEGGNQRRRMKYKSKEEIDKLYNSGKITDAQYKFYETTSRIISELAPYNVSEDRMQQDYIPHTAPGMMEKFAKRGLLGVIADSKSPDEKYKDVVFKEFVDPITGEIQENISYRDINRYFMSLGDLSQNPQANKDKNSLKYIKAFTKYKLKAIELGNKGINEDGSPIQYSDLHVQSTLGDFTMNEFSRSRGIDAELLPTTDLNKAFSDYINSSLIVNGNKEFKGLKHLYPLIDGVIHLAEMNDNQNLKTYVEKVWKEGFVKGQKQEVIPTNKYFELFNTTPDKIVKFGVKASMLYWLGLQGLLLGGGAYAVGNIIAGKYFNIKNQGGKSWWKGEKRFWFGKDVDWKNPLGGLKQSLKILKDNGFMDINVYDDVSIHEQNKIDSLFSDIALLPMIFSEKWIQGVNFLGLLTDEEYDAAVAGEKISSEKMAQYENTVKKNHGKGYQPTDQRLVQMYSFGQAMMQFNRHIPTVAYDSFSKRDINIYGEEEMGSSRALVKTLMQYISGFKSQKEFKVFWDGLDSLQKERTLSALTGLGMLSVAWAGYEFGGIEDGRQLVKDANAPLDFDKLSFKIKNPPVISMFSKGF